MRGVEINKIVNGDCLEVMKDIPDKWFNLAIVDPPYGIHSKLKGNNSSRPFSRMYGKSTWDVAPDEKYFNELLRVSTNQIICGGNYFKELPPCRGFIIWDKQQPLENFSHCEFLWTSFDQPAKMFRHTSNTDNLFGNKEVRFHPTQKPVALYKWLLKNYAKAGDKILDTHAGSCSSVVACIDMGFEYLAIERDKDYFEASLKRVEKELIKIKMF